MRSRRTIGVVGCHAEGEIGDVIIGGVLPPAGATMLDKMQAMAREHDDLRRLLICEPRGSVARHVNLLLPPTRPDRDAGAIIMEPTEYPPMSGSNTICVVTLLLGTGAVPVRGPVTTLRLDMPGGPVDVRAECRAGKCVAVEFADVPAFAAELDAPLEVEGVSIVQLAAPFAGPGEVSRNTCIFAPGRCDRSPTGTGTPARMAVLHARGQLAVGESMIHQSVIGSIFTGRIAGTTTVGTTPAVETTIKGRGRITGRMTYFVDDSDPYPAGYVVADTWGRTPGLSQG